MDNVIMKIKEIDKTICDNIDIPIIERGLLSQNLLAQLRTFVETISLLIYFSDKLLAKSDNDYLDIKNALDYIKSGGNYKFISKLHNMLQISKSHYSVDNDSAERLMIKYYEYLLKIKNFLKEKYSLEVLNNIENFPLNTDSTFEEYYAEISRKIEGVEIDLNSSFISGRFYIQKIKPFFQNKKVYYEVTLSPATDNASKFDRIIAYTSLSISINYSVKVSFVKEDVYVFGRKTGVKIINNWLTSIRPCEFNNYFKIFGIRAKISGNSKEYYELMKYLSSSNNSLYELITMKKEYYNEITGDIREKVKSYFILDNIDVITTWIERNLPGVNVVKYLTHTLNNKIIKSQYSNNQCEKLSNLFLSYKCIPFDQMPFATALVNHNPKLSNLFDCFEITGREHELLSKRIQNNTERNGMLYTPLIDLTSFENIPNLVAKYNEKLYYTHAGRSMILESEYIYSKGNEENTIDIIKKLIELSEKGIKGYTNLFNSWIDERPSEIDCEEKREILSNMFENSRVALIYGAAGTGKSTLINHISRFLNDKNKLFLANTHPAIENLRSKVKSSNNRFLTIAKFLQENYADVDCDILVIDECSTVSNYDMNRILKKAKFELIILVGDIYQIESINFGNWFNIAKNLISDNSVYELKKPYRSKNNDLQMLWDLVRKLDDSIIEYIAKRGYSQKLDQEILKSSSEDEIILCLNYDGLYGINNINRFLQENNPTEQHEWGISTFKVGDPILFNESRRFHPAIYNNLKGKIQKIEIIDSKIWFEIEIDKAVNELDILNLDLEIIGEPTSGKTLVKFYVEKHIDSDEEDDVNSNSTIPFIISYAVSIHKSQGLEYNSVKIIITSEMEELITHNIFYTAITRAREKLKICWTPETENKIINDFKTNFSNRDSNILKNKIKKSGAVV